MLINSHFNSCRCCSCCLSACLLYIFWLGLLSGCFRALSIPLQFSCSLVNTGILHLQTVASKHRKLSLIGCQAHILMYRCSTVCSKRFTVKYLSAQRNHQSGAHYACRQYCYVAFYQLVSVQFIQMLMCSKRLHQS